MTILFSVLNWGIGHASRSAVIIDALLAKNYKVDVFSNGLALRFLQERYSDNCTYIYGASNEVYNYTDDKKITYLILAKKLYKAAKHDSTLLVKHCKSNNYTALINDCRPIFTKKIAVKTVLINHQINPEWPFLNSIIQKRFIKWQNEFSAVWIPDFDNSLFSDSLSKSDKIRNKKWLGPLSRFNFFDNYNAENNGSDNKSLVFYAYSESEIGSDLLNELKKTFNTISFLDAKNASSRSDIDIVTTVQNADGIIAKPGYSSIMELYSCPTLVILIDRPWHAEQHFLFQHHQKNLFFTCLSAMSVQDIAVLCADNYNKKPRIANKKLLTLAIESIR